MEKICRERGDGHSGSSFQRQPGVDLLPVHPQPSMMETRGQLDHYVSTLYKTAILIPNNYM